MGPDTHYVPPAPTPESAAPEKSGAVGPIVGAVIVIALLIIGGFYFWGSYLNNRAPEQLPLIVGDQVAPVVNDNSDLSNSDTAADIQVDVESGYLDTLQKDLDADLQSIEQSLQNL